MNGVHRRWRIHVLCILVYTLLALALTWPLAGHLGSHVPGDGADDPPLTWNLWWVRHALLEQGTNPFFCDSIFYPIGINLAFYTLTVLNGLLSIPLQGVLGLIPASNLLLLSSFVLSGYGAFLLARYSLTRAPARTAGGRRQAILGKPAPGASNLAAFIGGLLYAFSSSKLSYAALGQWNIASSQWIPFYILCLLQIGDRAGKRRFALMAALFLLFQAYAEMTYATFLVLFTALWLVWQLLTQSGFLQPMADRNRAQLRTLMADVAVLALVFLVGLLPVLVMMVPDLRVEGDIFVEGSGFAEVFSADLIGFLVPTMHHPAFGGLVERFSFDYTVGQHLYPGYTAVVLAIFAMVFVWPMRQVRFWSVSALAFWLLTLGPTLRINGHSTNVPLPFALVSRLPFFNGNRYPSRYSVLLTLSLAMLVTFAVAVLMEWARRHLVSADGRAGLPGSWRRLAPLLVLSLGPTSLMLAEHLSIPLPLSDMRIPPVYEVVAAGTPEGSTLLDIPVAWRNGFRVTGTSDTIIMFEQYYQSLHARYLLAGNTSRNPPLKFQYFTEAPVINTLIALETGHMVDAATLNDDRLVAADVLQFFNISAIVVHRREAGPDVVSYVQATLPVEPMYEDETTLAFRVLRKPDPESWSVVPGELTGRLGLIEGWSAPSGGVVWAQRKANRILAVLNGQQQEMTFRAFAPQGGQLLHLEVNGSASSSIELQPGWADYRITLDEDTVQPGLNEIWMRFDRLYPAHSAEVAPRDIGQTGTASPVNLVVVSAGLEVGDMSRIYVDGQEVSPNERGYNIAVLSPETGVVEETATFDTHLEDGASQALATFLSKVPPGSIVAVSIADEASRLLGSEAVDALRGIGAQEDLQGRFRWGHAVVGIKGAVPGTALEALGWMRPITLAIGDGLTESKVAAAFATITFNATPHQ